MSIFTGKLANKLVDMIEDETPHSAAVVFTVASAVAVAATVLPVRDVLDEVHEEYMTRLENSIVNSLAPWSRSR